MVKTRAASGLIELLHSVDVLIESLGYVIVGIVIRGIYGNISCECHLAVLEEGQSDEVVIQLTYEQRHLVDVALVRKHDS